MMMNMVCLYATCFMGKILPMRIYKDVILANYSTILRNY